MLGLKSLCLFILAFLMVVFVPVWERETNPLAFSVVTTILNGLVLNCSKWKEKSYSFCFCRRGCGRVDGSDELWFQVLSQGMPLLKLLGFTAQLLKSAA